MNIVFLFSDEHAGAVMGNSGHPVVQTPHLDRLSEQSYTFDNAYPRSTQPTRIVSYRFSVIIGVSIDLSPRWGLFFGAMRKLHRCRPYMVRLETAPTRAAESVDMGLTKIRRSWAVFAALHQWLKVLVGTSMARAISF